MITLGWWVYRGWSALPSHQPEHLPSAWLITWCWPWLPGQAVSEGFLLYSYHSPFPHCPPWKKSLTQLTLKSLPAWGGRCTFCGDFSALEIWISFTIYLFNISINSWCLFQTLSYKTNTGLRSLFRFCQFGHGSSFQWTICAVLWLCTWACVCVHVSLLPFISDTTRGSPLTCVFPAPAPELAISPGALAPCPHRPMDPRCQSTPSPPGRKWCISDFRVRRLKPCLLHPLWAVGFSLWHVRSHDAGEAGRRGRWTSRCPLLLEAKKKFNQLIENKMCIESHPTPEGLEWELTPPRSSSMTPLPCPCYQSPPGGQAHYHLPLLLSCCNREECCILLQDNPKGMLPWLKFYVMAHLWAPHFPGNERQAKILMFGS